MSLISFHGKPELKHDLLLQLQAHHDADEIIKGTYWQDGKGCAVGCTVHSSNHGDYETQLGIPRILARLEDGIFEGLPNQRAKAWPLEFINAIKPGVNLSGVWPKFAVFLLTDIEHGVIKFAKTDKQKEAIQKISDMYADTTRIISTNEWLEARNAAAAAAAYAADAAADAAAYAADAAAYAAAYAADAAADAAAYAADAAADAAAYAADAADAAARQKARVAQADKLLELLRECN